MLELETVTLRPKRKYVDRLDDFPVPVAFSSLRADPPSRMLYQGQEWKVMYLDETGGQVGLIRELEDGRHQEVTLRAPDVEDSPIASKSEIAAADQLFDQARDVYQRVLNESVTDEPPALRETRLVRAEQYLTLAASQSMRARGYRVQIAPTQSVGQGIALRILGYRSVKAGEDIPALARVISGLRPGRYGSTDYSSIRDTGDFFVYDATATRRYEAGGFSLFEGGGRSVTVSGHWSPRDSDQLSLVDAHELVHNHLARTSTLGSDRKNAQAGRIIAFEALGEEKPLPGMKVEAHDSLRVYQFRRGADEVDARLAEVGAHLTQLRASKPRRVPVKTDLGLAITALRNAYRLAHADLLNANQAIRAIDAGLAGKVELSSRDGLGSQFDAGFINLSAVFTLPAEGDFPAQKITVPGVKLIRFKGESRETFAERRDQAAEALQDPKSKLSQDVIHLARIQLERLARQREAVITALKPQFEGVRWQPLTNPRLEQLLTRVRQAQFLARLEPDRKPPRLLVSRTDLDRRRANWSKLPGPVQSLIEFAARKTGANVFRDLITPPAKP
jgi:hypothetical protein